MRAQPRSPMLVVTVTDHASPPAVDALWQRTQKELASSSPRGRLVVAAGSGHDVYADAPELVALEIERLLREEASH